MRLENRVAYVTGAGNGIGRATVEAMSREGARVAVVDRDGNAAEAVADELRNRGADAIALTVDVQDAGAVKASLEETVERLGGLNILHLNAAMALPNDTNIVDTPAEAWETGFAVNVMGVVNCAKYGIPLMIESGGGNIVITSSGGGEAGDYTRVAYGSLKSTVTSLTRYIVTTFGRDGINANSILPGLVLTENVRPKFPEPFAAAVRKHQTTDRMTLPSDIANLAVFLASDEAIAIQGQAIRIDAGVSAMGGASPDLLEAMKGLV